eukprot:scaffold3289_cov163-Amphora_coffeaeformis.AAC.5
MRPKGLSSSGNTGSFGDSLYFRASCHPLLTLIHHLTPPGTEKEVTPNARIEQRVRHQFLQISHLTRLKPTDPILVRFR